MGAKIERPQSSVDKELDSRADTRTFWQDAGKHKLDRDAPPEETHSARNSYALARVNDQDRVNCLLKFLLPWGNARLILHAGDQNGRST